MIKKIKDIINTDDKKRLLSNFVSLSILQGANYLVPLIVVPYLFAVLGTEKYGLVVFAQSLVGSFGLFVNYGFNLSATKEIAVNQKSLKKVSEIYSTVTTIKIIFSLVVFFIFSIIIFNFNKFSDDKLLFLLSFGAIIESILFPVWFFQGMEKMKYITIIYSVSKIIVGILIVTLIKQSSDYLLVPVLYFFGALSSGIISLIILYKYFKIQFSIPSLTQIKYQLKEGWHLFVSNISINLYRNSNILILGFITAPLYVGYYALAEKVIKALQSLMGPISETLYPYIANKNSKRSVKKSLENLLNISKYYFFILFTIVCLVLVLAPIMVDFLSDTYIENIVVDMRILTGALFFGGFNYLFGIIGLVTLGFQKYFSLRVLIAGTINVVLCFILSPLLKDNGAAISLTISEFILTMVLLRKLYSLYKLQTIENEK